MSSPNLLVVVASQTGKTWSIVDALVAHLQVKGLVLEVIDLAMYPLPEHWIPPWEERRPLILITSTYGEGEVPDSASEFFSCLQQLKELQEQQYRDYPCAVLGIGDRYYPFFCQAGKDFTQLLEAQGCRLLLPTLLMEAHEEELFIQWRDQLGMVLKSMI